MNNDIKPKILAIDTSTQACSVSLSCNGQYYTAFALTPQTHANHVLSMVEQVLEQAGIKGESLDCLALSEGPGAFTGIRIAAGVVQGLAFGWNKPVISISTLEALAWPVLKDLGSGSVAACMDARMKELYFQICSLNNGVLTSEPALLLSEEDTLRQVSDAQIKTGVGDIGSEFPRLVALFDVWHEQLPNAEAVVEIAEQRMSNAHDVLEDIPLPVYLRNNVAEKPK